MIEAQTPNTIELANVLPLPTEQSESREQWLRRLLKNPLLDSPVVLEPFARTALEEAARNGQTVMLTRDQTDLGDRFAVLMLALQMGDRSLPLAWKVEAGAANIGFAGQPVLLEQVRAWLPPARTQRGCCWETGSIPPPSYWPGCRSTAGKVPPAVERQPDGRYRLL